MCSRRLAYCFCLVMCYHDSFSTVSFFIVNKTILYPRDNKCYLTQIKSIKIPRCLNVKDLSTTCAANFDQITLLMPLAGCFSPVKLIHLNRIIKKKDDKQLGFLIQNTDNVLQTSYIVDEIRDSVVIHVVPSICQPGFNA